MDYCISLLSKLLVPFELDSLKPKKKTIFNVIEIIAPFLSDLGASSLFDSCKNFYEYRKKYKHWVLKSKYSLMYINNHLNFRDSLQSKIIYQSKQLSLTLNISGFSTFEDLKELFNNFHTIYILRRGTQKLNFQYFTNTKIIYLQEKYYLNRYAGYSNSVIEELKAYDKELGELRKSETNIYDLMDKRIKQLKSNFRKKYISQLINEGNNYFFTFGVSKYFRDETSEDSSIKSSNYKINIRAESSNYKINSLNTENDLKEQYEKLLNYAIKYTETNE